MQQKLRAGLSLESYRPASSLINDLCLSEKALYACVINLGTTLKSDGDKLNHWAKHFKEVVNCQVDVDVSFLPV